MCEAENLIMSVEKYPCVWDINNVDYHNRDIKDLAWEQICKEVFDNWENCADKTNKCAELKRKWANIRDYYRKEVQKNKNVPTGSAAKKAKTYVYSQLLYFLTPMFSKRDSEGNYAQESDSQTENAEQNIEPEVPIDVSHIESPPVTNRPVLKRKKDVPTEILNILQQRQKTTAMPCNANEDDDTNFLMSFRSYMKKMNPKQKIDFQLGMLQLVKKITMENEPSPSQSPYTYSDNSLGSLPSPHSGHVYTPAPQSYYNSSPSPTYIPSMQRNIYAPKISPIYLRSPSQSPSASTHHSSSQQPVPSASTSKPKIVIRSIKNVTLPHSVNQQHAMEDYPEYITPETTAEDSQGPFIILKSEDSEEDNIKKYLKFNKTM